MQAFNPAVFNLIVRSRLIMAALNTLATYHVTEDASPRAAEAATCPPSRSPVPGLGLGPGARLACA